MLSKREFASMYGRAMGDLGRMRRHNDMRQPCQACEHGSYLYGCFCEQKGCNCLKRRTEIYAGKAAR